MAGALTVEALEEGPCSHLSALLASVIFVHSALLEGLRKGGALIAGESQTLKITTRRELEGRREEGKGEESRVGRGTTYTYFSVF